MGWGALGCSNLTASGARGGVARDVTIYIYFIFSTFFFSPSSLNSIFPPSTSFSFNYFHSYLSFPFFFFILSTQVVSYSLSYHSTLSGCIDLECSLGFTWVFAEQCLSWWSANCFSICPTCTYKFLMDSSVFFWVVVATWMNWARVIKVVPNQIKYLKVVLKKWS